MPAPFRDFFHQFGQGRQQQAPRKAIAMGSGFIIDKAGYIVTNNHVVDGATKITVKLQDGREFTAKLIGTDPATDMALLKINSDKPLPTVEFADDRQVRVGDWVDRGRQSLRPVQHRDGRHRLRPSAAIIGNGPYTDFIQIDAPINRGNSGGPTFDIQGKVIGMNTMIFSPSGGSVGIGFAIPSSTIHDVVAQLKAHGKVARGWLGVRDPELHARDGREPRHIGHEGRHRGQRRAGSPAAKAGFKQGDVVLALNGKAVDGFARPDPPGRGAACRRQGGFHRSLRNGKKKTLTAEIAQRKERAGRLQRGSQATMARPQHRQGDGPGSGRGHAAACARCTISIGNIDGVLITKVDPDSDAADKGLQPGDVVVSVGNQAVHSPADIKARIAEAERRPQQRVGCWSRRKAANASSPWRSTRPDLNTGRCASERALRSGPAPAAVAPIPPLPPPARTHYANSAAVPAGPF